MAKATPWTKIKGDYLSGITPRELAKKYKIKAKTITEKASKEDWVVEKATICKNVQEKIEDNISKGATEAVAYLREVVNNTKEETKDRIAAAKGLLSVSGLEKSEKKITGDITTSPTTFNILPVKSDTKK